MVLLVNEVTQALVLELLHLFLCHILNVLSLDLQAVNCHWFLLLKFKICALLNKFIALTLTIPVFVWRSGFKSWMMSLFMGFGKVCKIFPEESSAYLHKEETNPLFCCLKTGKCSWTFSITPLMLFNHEFQLLRIKVFPF